MGKPDKLGRKAKTATVSKIDRARLEDVASRLGRGKSLRTAFVWPGGDAELEVRVLTHNERSACDAAALRETQERLGDEFVPRADAHEALEGAKAKHLLALACMVPDTDEPFFASAQELGDIATDDEILRVFERYIEHKDATDPELEEMPVEHLDVILEAIKKKDSTSLKSIASAMPRNYLLTLVDRLASSLQDSSSST